MTLLSPVEIDRALAGLDGWRLDGEGALARDWKLADFADALAFVQRVGELSETANHHPDILLHGWNKVRLTLSTHSEDGLTKADVELAAQIDDLG